MPSPVLNLRPVASITQPILEALASRAALAQLVEHIIRNDGVRCSSHLSGTIFLRHLPALAPDGLLWTPPFIDDSKMAGGGLRQAPIGRML